MDRLHVVVLDWKTKKPTTIADGWDCSPHEIVWSKDDRALFATASGRVVSVMGAKGGVGLIIAHNLAWQIAQGLEMATIVADLDLGFGTAALDFNQDPPQGVAEAVFAPERVDFDIWSIACFPNAARTSVFSRLRRCSTGCTISARTSFDSLIDTVRASTPWVVLDIPHSWNAWTSAHAGRRR